ncbi:hypothetical protein M2310_001576 [Rhizobium leguminosarum]|uniref:Uncharacterized protein n=1 Tax=Rhizobium esperanzae TaxID=1967781 RepID=A0A7W6UGJ5_9HYPH|nr:hypothetical protein [Rhizobium esperanzae]MDH6200905.1 hypothetical protein [Rhizobium leguminosarum]
MAVRRLAGGSGFRGLMINVDAHCINLDCREILTDLPP